MISVCFYTSESYPRTIMNRLGHWLIRRWSKPFVHVDLKAGDLILSADMAVGFAGVFDAKGRVAPHETIDLPFDEDLATEVFRGYQDTKIHYGWVDFLLVPFRKWCSFNGGGVICSELVADALISMAERAPDDVLPEDIITRMQDHGSHAYTPQSLYDLLSEVAPGEESPAEPQS